jgi:hypothetical protein
MRTSWIKRNQETRVVHLGARNLGCQRQPAMGREINYYKRPKVFGEKCLGHGISPWNTAAILASKLMPSTSAIDCGRNGNDLCNL